LAAIRFSRAGSAGCGRTSDGRVSAPTRIGSGSVFGEK
jgi:hypothetical protein